MRKAPRQARAKDTVERIVAAGRRVLIEEGYDAFSTNRVARAAGVSPGSLYQYFDDKAAILDLVLDRYWDTVAEQVAAALADRLTETGPAMIRATADALLAALERDRVLLRVLVEELPVARNRERRAGLEKRVRELVALYLAARPSESERLDPALAAWVIVLAVESLAMRWSLDEPAFEREALLDEIVALIAGYLRAT